MNSRLRGIARPATLVVSLSGCWEISAICQQKRDRSSPTADAPTDGGQHSSRGQSRARALEGRQRRLDRSSDAVARRFSAEPNTYR
jgi:hypothetical protein